MADSATPGYIKEVTADFDKTGVFVGSDAFQQSRVDIQPWIDIPTLLPYLYKYRLLSSEDDSYQLSDKVVPSARMEHLFVTLPRRAGEYGYHLLYMCIRESATIHLGHQDAAQELRNYGTRELPSTGLSQGASPPNPPPSLSHPNPPPTRSHLPPRSHPLTRPQVSVSKQEVEIRHEVDKSGKVLKRTEKKTTTTEMEYSMSTAYPQFQTDSSLSRANPQFQTDSSMSTAYPQSETDSSMSTANPQFQTDSSMSTAYPQSETDSSMSTANPQFQTDSSMSTAYPQTETDSSSFRPSSASSTGSYGFPIEETQPAGGATGYLFSGASNSGGPSGMEGPDIEQDSVSGVRAHQPEPVSDGRTEAHVQDSDEDHCDIPPEDLTKKERIGDGAGGQVYQGWWEPKRIDVAIKELNVVHDKEHLIREITTFSKLRHPNIIRFFGKSILDGRWCIIMELAPLGSLYNHLREHHMKPSLPQSLRWAIEIASGVRYLHECDITHRDLKSLNILLANAPQDTYVHAKICDLGSAKESCKEVFTLTITTGTNLWKPPEALRGGKKKKASKKWDVYSYGIVLWELMTHGIPFSHLPDFDPDDLSGNAGPHYEAVVIRNERPPIPSGCDLKIETLMRNCWKLEPDERPTFDQIVVALKEIVP